jgi:hypothetical protein
MAETVFASKEIKEFALIEPLASFALSLAQIVEFPKDLLMRHSPRNRRNRKRDNKQSQKLLPRHMHQSLQKNKQNRNLPR